MKLTVATVVLLATTSLASAAPLKTGDIIRGMQDDTVACADPATLREVKSQLANVGQPPDLESRLAKLNCGMIAADLDWKVAEPHGDTVRAQLVFPSATFPLPIMYFAVADVRLRP
jgi:hypothetical protein